MPRPPGTPAPQPSSQERSGLLASSPRRRRKHRPRDKRPPQDGYTINVYNGRQPSTGYSISDGHYGGEKFKRELSGSMAQPWPNDKHWNSQHYESRELGDDKYLY